MYENQNDLAQFLRNPTLFQLRQFCQMSVAEVAQESNVRLCRVSWIERGIASKRVDVVRVLQVLSKRAKIPYRIEDIRGVRIQDESFLWI